MTSIRHEVKASAVPDGKVLFSYLDDDKEVERLLIAGADPNYLVAEGWWKGWSLLAYAVYKEKVTLVNLLLSFGANPEQCIPKTEKTLFTYSFAKETWGNLSFVPFPSSKNIAFSLIKRGAMIPNTVNLTELLDSFLIKTVWDKKLDFALIKLFASIPFIGKGLLSACRNLRFSNLAIIEAKCIRKLIREILKTDEKLHFLANDQVKTFLEHRNWEIAYQLIIRNFPIPWLCENKSSEGKLAGAKCSPLVWILKNTSSDDFMKTFSFNHENPTRCFEAILERGFNPNEIFVHNDITWSPLVFAIFHKNTVLARLLLKYGAALNQVAGEWGDSLLFFAAERGYHEIISDLIKKKEYLEDKHTALEISIEKEHLHSIALLFQNKARLDLPRTLHRFLQQCDPRDPDVLISLLALYEKYSHLLVEDEVIWIEAQVVKLIQLTEIANKEVFSAVDLALDKIYPELIPPVGEALENKYPKVILDIIMEYTSPLQHKQIRFFKLTDLNKEANSNSSRCCIM